MKNRLLIIILLIFPSFLFAQKYQSAPNTQAKYLRADSGLIIPDDTTTSTVNTTDSCRRIAKKNNILYAYNCDSAKWIIVQGRSRSLQETTNTGDTTKNVISYTGFDNIPNVTGLTIGRGIMYSGSIFGGTKEDLQLLTKTYTINATGGMQVISGNGFDISSSGSKGRLQADSIEFVSNTSGIAAKFNSWVSGFDARFPKEFITKTQLDSLAANAIDTTSLSNRINGKEPLISSGANTQYWRGDKTFQTLNIAAIPGLIDSFRTASNGLKKVVNVIKLGGNLTESTILRTDSFNLRILNNRPAFIEFQRTGAGLNVGSSVASVGMHGNPEANLCFNMDYTDGIHRLYDTTKGAMWLALGAGTLAAGNIGAVQYAVPNSNPATDVWSSIGAPYALWWKSVGLNAQFAVNNNVNRTVFDANMMIVRAAAQANLGGLGDFVLDGSATKGQVAKVYVNLYNTGNSYISPGGGNIIAGPDTYAPVEKLSVYGSIETRSNAAYTNNIAQGYIAFRDFNGKASASIGRTSTVNKDLYFTNSIGTKSKFINMPDTAQGGSALAYVSMMIDSSRNVSIGDTTPTARFNVTGTVKFNVPSAAKWDLYKRDSATGFLAPIAAGTPGQVLTVGYGGNPGWAGIQQGSDTSRVKYEKVKKAITANTTMDSTATKWLIDCTSTDVTITLPDASISPYWISTGTNVGYGIKYYILRTDNTAHVLTIQAGGTQKIDGQSNFSIYNNSYLNLFSDGANWYSN